MCKWFDGASFPIEVKSMEDGISDSVHALCVDEADDGPRASSYFHETVFNDVGGAELTP